MRTIDSEKRKEHPDKENLVIEPVIISVYNPNQLCAIIVDDIFNKIIELLNKDLTINGFKRNILIESALRHKEPIKNYILEMDKGDAQDIINKIKNAIK